MGYYGLQFITKGDINPWQSLKTAGDSLLTKQQIFETREKIIGLYKMPESDLMDDLQSQDVAMQKLAMLTGLENVKRDVVNLAGFAKVQKMREEKSVKKESCKARFFFLLYFAMEKCLILYIVEKSWKISFAVVIKIIDFVCRFFRQIWFK